MRQLLITSNGENLRRLLPWAAGLAVALWLFPGVAHIASAQEAAEHPFIEAKELKTETCLMCHTDKKKGKFVHSVMAMGCEACHQAASKDNKTTITLMAPATDLCHQVAKEDVMHAPYEKHQCVVCHDPHSSNFVAHTREATNALCLQCHLTRPIKGATVSLAGGIEVPSEEVKQAPKLMLDALHQNGHPWIGHPVGGRPDPLHPGEKMSCLSCHQPHSSTQENLIIAEKKGPSVCDKCHEAVEAEKAKEKEEMFKKLHPNLQKPQPQKQQPSVPPNWKPSGEKK